MLEAVHTFNITYEEFVARAVAQLGREEAERMCPEYGRTFARECRMKARSASPEDAKTLHRLANRMDPDLR